MSTRAAAGLGLCAVAAVGAVVIAWPRSENRGELPIAVDLKDSWRRVAGERGLSRASSGAGRAQREVQAQQLRFYAQTTSDFHDVRLAVVTGDFDGILVVRRQPTGGEGLAALARRQVSEAKAQGSSVVARPATLDGERAWRLEFDTGSTAYRQVHYWLERERQRYSVEISGPPSVTRDLTRAVRMR